MRGVPFFGTVFAAALVSCSSDDTATGKDGGAGGGQSDGGGASVASGGARSSGGTAAGGVGAATSGGGSSGRGGASSGAASGSLGAGGRSGSSGAAGSTSASGAAGTGGKGSGGATGLDGGEDSGSPSGGAGPGAYPDSTTTGPVLSKCAGGVLKRYSGSGDYRPKNGEIVSCMEFQNAAIYIPAEISGVTIENCRFVTTRDVFLNIQGSGVTIQDSKFEGPAGTWIRNSYSGDHLTIRRNEFTGMGNAVEFNVGYEVIEDNYAHDFGTADPGQHADGLQTDGTSHAVVRHNTVLLNADAAGATGAISIFDGVDVQVENNKVAGGGYTVYPGGTNSSNVRFIGNCFSTVFYPGQAKIGVYNAWYPSNNPKDLVRTGNTWCDGPKAGQPLDVNP